MVCKKVAIYCRTSTVDNQTTDNQRLCLADVAVKSGWTIVDIFDDTGISGTKGRNERPAFNQLLQGIARREFHMVLAWSVDRLGRSLPDLVGFLGDLNAAHIDLYLHQQGLDTSAPFLADPLCHRTGWKPQSGYWLLAKAFVKSHAW